MIFNFQFRHFCVVQVNGASNQPVWSKAPKSCFEQDWSRLPIETLPMQHFKQPELLLDPGPRPRLSKRGALPSCGDSRQMLDTQTCLVGWSLQLVEARSSRRAPNVLVVLSGCWGWPSNDGWRLGGAAAATAGSNQPCGAAAARLHKPALPLLEDKGILACVHSPPPPPLSPKHPLAT